MLDRLLIRIELSGPIPTGNPSSVSPDRRSDYRERIQSAIRNATWARPVPTEGGLRVRILVSRPVRRRGDADNLAKPVLDALGPLIGLDRRGRAYDHRVRYLEIGIRDSPSERVVIEVHALASTCA